MLLAPLLLLVCWYLFFRQLKEVYLDKDFMLVANKKILYSDIVSFKKDNPPFPTYSVNYSEGGEVKRFKFSPKSFLFFKPSSIKKLEGLVNMKK